LFRYSINIKNLLINSKTNTIQGNTRILLFKINIISCIKKIIYYAINNIKYYVENLLLFNKIIDNENTKKNH